MLSSEEFLQWCGRLSLSQAARAAIDGIGGPRYYSSWTADTHKTRGAHSIEFGGGIIHTTFTGDNQTGTQVQFSSLQTSNFAPQTGFALASFILGTPESAGRVIGNTASAMHGNGYSLYVQDTFRANKKLTLNLGLRYDYVSPLINDFGSGTFVWETGSYVWSKANPITNEPANVSAGAIDPDRRGFQPRAGVAYQVSNKTVVRMGYGIFFDSFGNNYAQTQQGNRGNWPFSFPQTVSGLNALVPNAFLQNPFPGPAAGSRTPLGCQQCLNVFKNSSRTPYVHEWTLSIQRQLTPSLMAEAVYFGSHGLKLSGQIIDNTAVRPGPGSIAERQRWPQFPAIYVLNGMNIFPSYYEGMSVKLDKRFSQNLSFLINYTWSKNIDYVDSFVNAGIGGSPFSNPTRFNTSANRGLAGFDVPHRVVASYIYQLPVKSHNKIANAVVGNWSVTGIVSFDSGLPNFVVLTSDNENIGTVPGRFTEFPNLVGDPRAVSRRTPEKWFNTDAYALPPAFTVGNAGRRALRGPRFGNWDSSIFKRWPFQESRDVEFRSEFFNFTNHTNFGYPGVLLGTPQFGRVSSTRNPGRQVQLGLKLRF